MTRNDLEALAKDLEQAEQLEKFAAQSKSEDAWRFYITEARKLRKLARYISRKRGDAT